ncbi:MAG: hypothetical protein HZA91_19490 [Verrucomicrobia bacterium]|nr:hypothetical protein [Verrucomicrobiota bacterium]
MDWLDKLERRLGRFAVPGLTRLIVGFNVAAFVLLRMDSTWIKALILDPDLVAGGEIWRLVSYLFIPPTLDPIWLFFALYLFWIMGDGLEQEWGAFKLNVFYLVGMIATTVVAFFIAHNSVTNAYLNLSLFFAFATVFPNFEILLFFILPVKVKWLAAVSAAFVAWTILTAPMGGKLAAVVSLANYLVFFGPQFWQMALLNRQVAKRRAEFETKKREGEADTWHRCVVCNRTEQDNADLEFRVADDDREYCMEHLAQAPERKKA